MRFFDFVKKYHRIGIAPHLFTELSAFVKSHIPGRGTDHFGYGMRLHIFRHIHPDQCLFRAEHGFRQRFAELCFSHAGRPQKQKGTDGTIGILQPHPAPAHRFRHGGDGFILADNPFVQNRLHFQKSLALLFSQPGNRNFRPDRHHIGNLIFADQQLPVSQLFLISRLRPFVFLYQFCLTAPDLPGLQIRFDPNGTLDLQIHLLNLFLHILQIFRHIHIFQPHGSGGLVNQINRLIRQISVIDIAVR